MLETKDEMPCKATAPGQCVVTSAHVASVGESHKVIRRRKFTVFLGKREEESYFLKIYTICHCGIELVYPPKFGHDHITCLGHENMSRHMVHFLAHSFPLPQ